MRVIPITGNSRKNDGGDARSIMAYSHYLIMKAQIAGNFRFDGHRATSEEVEISTRCKSLCDNISRKLPICKLNDIPELLECYDILYRIGYRRIPDADFIDRFDRRFFNSWKAGNKGVEESKVFEIVAKKARNPQGKTDMEQVKAYLSILDRWIVTLDRHSCFPNVTAYENYQRLALVMRERLDGYFSGNADEMKRRWYDHNKVDDLSTLSSVILRSYRRFVNSLSPSVIDFDEKMELDNRILIELSIRTDLHPYDRQAFRLALQYNNVTING